MQVEVTRMYRVKDVAGHFQVSAATIYRAIESGALDAVKLGSGRDDAGADASWCARFTR